MHIAWTVDDGPTPFTKDMIAVFKGPIEVSPGKSVKRIPATWYIQRNRLTEADIKTYVDLQNTHGHEIAIHGINPDKDHLSWFQSKLKPSYASISDAITDLGAFHAYLGKNGLKAKFIRLPYGLQTELVHRLKATGEGGDADATARAIVKGALPPKASPGSQATANEYAELLAAATKLGLHLWGGSSKGAVSALSWEAESAAANTGRTDNVPEKQLNMMKALASGARTSASFVILCHDTTKGDVDEVKADIKAMEAEAAKQGVTIVYHTMSSLYAKVVGKAP